MADAKKDKLQIRNSTVDFLVFTKDAHEDGIEVRVQDHDVWLTQKAIARLFDVDRSVVTKHLKNVYESGELSEDATCANFAQVADNGPDARIGYVAKIDTVSLQVVDECIVGYQPEELRKEPCKRDGSSHLCICRCNCTKSQCDHR